MEVEVFKTNVHESCDAKALVETFKMTFRNYSVTFDLDDCDRILRVSSSAPINISDVIDVMKRNGFKAEVLPDEIPALLSGEPVISR